jgi:hypothetical protein
MAAQIVKAGTLPLTHRVPGWDINPFGAFHNDSERDEWYRNMKAREAQLKAGRSKKH